MKKLLVACLFGMSEGKFFPAPWTAEDFLSYVRSIEYPGRTTRVSAFRNDISCHARSEVVGSKWSDARCLAFLRSFDSDTTLNVFPQQHTEQMCFRVVFGETGLILEAGWGQAMYVFETERGDHPIISSKLVSAEGLIASDICAPEELSASFRLFLESHRDWLQSVYETLPMIIGTTQFAIEGYFDPKSGKRVIVDMDIPLDLAWN
ncbi:MAG: hypothetical protein ABJT31_11015 [Hyphomicrobiales bacterium]